MQCVEKGLLDLDADISAILPEWKDPKILTGFNEKNEPQFRPAKRPLTLRCVALEINYVGHIPHH
jgi:CubicO group peptidase (beta-lactamase class C family)